MLTQAELARVAQRHSLYYMKLRRFLDRVETSLNILLYLTRVEQLSYKL